MFAQNMKSSLLILQQRGNIGMDKCTQICKEWIIGMDKFAQINTVYIIEMDNNAQIHNIKHH